MYSFYCTSNFFWDILECSLLCVHFDLLSHIHLLAPSGVLFSQLIMELKNLAAVVVAVAVALQTEALIDSVPE
jgi:hypothetical protein